MEVKKRIDGIDAARGLALFGMFAAHALWDFNDAGDPSKTTMFAAGRSAGMFAVLAGVSIALMSGGRKPVEDLARRIAASGLIARAITLAILGLLMGLLRNHINIHFSIIIAFYGLAFLFAVPLIWLRARTLVIVATAIALIAPVIIYLVENHVPDDIWRDPQITDLFVHPYGLLTFLLFTGSYPVIALMAYVAAGVALGRLDLSSSRVAIWLTGGGLALAAVSWIAATVLLLNFGGLDRLYETNTVDLDNDITRTTVLWSPQANGTTPWELAQRAPHAYSTFSIAHAIGSSMVILGWLLLITRIEILRKVLYPLRAAGSMPLTIYTLQIGMLYAWWWEVDPVKWYEGMVVTAMVFASAWRYFLGQGPLERLVGLASRLARNAYKSRSTATVAT